MRPELGYADEEERLGPPCIYKGSPVMHHKDIPRQDVELGEILGHIDRTGKRYQGTFDPQIAPQPDEDIPHPYLNLRVGVSAETYARDRAAVVIDREQAKALQKYLASWIEHTEGSESR